MTGGSDAPVAEALALLTRRDYSEAELADRLRRKGHGREAIETAVARCREMGYLDDEAYAHARAATLVERRPSGARALAQDLRRRGVARTMSEQVVERVLDEAGGERAVLERALKAWIERNGEPADWRSARRCADHLARRGFPGPAVTDALAPWLDELARP